MKTPILKGIELPLDSLILLIWLIHAVNMLQNVCIVLHLTDDEFCL